MHRSLTSLLFLLTSPPPPIRFYNMRKDSKFNCSNCAAVNFIVMIQLTYSCSAYSGSVNSYSLSSGAYQKLPAFIESRLCRLFFFCGRYLYTVHKYILPCLLTLSAHQQIKSRRATHVRMYMSFHFIHKMAYNRRRAFKKEQKYSYFKLL